MTIKEPFMELVKQMRSAQREYFRTKGWEALALSKMLEKDVDNAIREAESDQLGLFEEGHE